MIEYAILGIIQGVAEWLPVSSEGILVLSMSFLGFSGGIEEAVKLALFLHLGTFFAALVYFWSDVKSLIAALFYFQSAKEETKRIFWFLLFVTLISGTLGFLLLKILSWIGEGAALGGSVVMGIIGVMLIVTGLLQFKTETSTVAKRSEKDTNVFDTLLLGVIQGFAAFPGLSRSGTTVAALLLRRYEKTLALKLSFLMSLPIVFAGNILLNYQDFTAVSSEKFIALLFSFVFGILTIHLLLKLAEKIRFGPLVIFFGILTIAAAFI